MYIAITVVFLVCLWYVGDPK